MFLGSLNAWPDWLADGGSLSCARHTLWSDALSLWASQPPDPVRSRRRQNSLPMFSTWRPLHPLLLQVGSELGAIGVILLGALLVGGLLFAARGSRPPALIAMAAWTALAVHSTVDHLEDFPIVAVMGGVVLGWSGFVKRPFADSSVSRTPTPELDV